MNKNLEQMVNALLNKDNDKAKEHLSAYFDKTAAGILNPPEPVAQTSLKEFYINGTDNGNLSSSRKSISINDIISINDLANKFNISPTAVLATLNKLRISVPKNGYINFESAELLGRQFGYTVIRESLDMVTQLEEGSCWFDVYKDGKKIDSLHSSEKDTAENVKKSLVDHDGYDSDITVKKRKNPKKAVKEGLCEGAEDHHFKNICPKCEDVSTCRCKAEKKVLTHDLCYSCKE